MSDDLAKKKQGEGVSLMASPVQMVKDGKRAAKALMDVIRENPGWAIKFGDSKDEYLVFEAWQTVAQFFGYAVDTSQIPERVEFGEVKGFQAVAVVIDKKTGNKVGGATGLCMNDEENWNTEDHENRFKKMVKGKPLYQLASMAQTRAGSKALRNIFAWVVVLAGYKATPAEEMTHTTIQSHKPSEPQNQPLASEKQVKLLRDLADQGRVEEKEFEKLTIREASEMIDKGFKTEAGTIKLSPKSTVPADEIDKKYYQKTG